MRSYTSKPLEVPVLDEGESIARADLVFYGVDHGSSYEARVFVNRPRADEKTPLDPKKGYAGSFTVFGHAGCYGDEGHCLPEARTRDEFDKRAPHPLERWTKTVIGTEALSAAIQDPKVEQVKVTVVPVGPRAEGQDTADDPLQFEAIRVIAYED